MYLLGFDIGGTKCAVITARYEDGELSFCGRESIPTDRSVGPYEMIDRLCALADTMLEEKPCAIGISCGNPMDSKKGIILSPPNLPGWDNVEIVRVLEERYGAHAYLQNDADACAIAEWRFGAGRGVQNMVFMTFGTGLGAGLILDGRLYAGTNDNAGEAGHIRLAKIGPVGYGKEGSFEGFCSGGGIAQIGQMLIREKLQMGESLPYWTNMKELDGITAKVLAENKADFPFGKDIKLEFIVGENTAALYVNGEREVSTDRVALTYYGNVDNLPLVRIAVVVRTLIKHGVKKVARAVTVN